MVEIQKSEIEIKEKNSFLKDSFIIWDSLSVGITSHYKKFDWIVKWGKQTSWMLEQLKNNPYALKDKKIMFVLWWTNDVFQINQQNILSKILMKWLKLHDKIE